MPDADCDDLHPDRVRDVEVPVDDEWLIGELEAVDKQAGVWRGWVRYSAVPGQGNYLDWFSEPSIRRIRGLRAVVDLCDEIVKVIARNT